MLVVASGLLCVFVLDVWSCLLCVVACCCSLCGWLLRVASWFVLNVCCVMFVVRGSLLVVRCWLLVVGCWLLVVCCLGDGCCGLFVDCCWLFGIVCGCVLLVV